MTSSEQSPDASLGAGQAIPVVSLVIPFYNEEENAEPVLEELAEVLRKLDQPWEVIAVDDGSTDRTLARLQHARSKMDGLRILRMRRNAGQTAAMQAGFDAVRGQVVVTLGSWRRSTRATTLSAAGATTGRIAGCHASCPPGWPIASSPW
jgi:cellulose synthase/poly-beta-1,6-N-acetylglucosamine synthase-like glycosyltransferase